MILRVDMVDIAANEMCRLRGSLYLDTYAHMTDEHVRGFYAIFQVNAPMANPKDVWYLPKVKPWPGPMGSQRYLGVSIF